MDKQKQLIEYCIQDIVEFITDDRNIPFDKAMELFYSTEVFLKLTDTETGLYRESPSYVYDLLKNEFKNGRLIQEEI